jgi:hypothetical protein
LRVNRSIGAPTLVQNLTIEVTSGERALTHEGRGDANLTGRHEVRRLILRDDGTTAGAPALQGMSLGTDVVAHDILIHGDFAACVRFGPRTGEGSSTPTTAAYVHHLTCRLTTPLSGSNGAVFEVANVDGVVIADIAAELADAGAIFRAQRRTSGDTGTFAIDTPDAFVAHSLVVRGHATVYDDFDPLDGTFTVTALAEPLGAAPFFVSDSDSHLAPLAVGIDDGVDPSTLDGQLSLGVSVDGVDRAGQSVDRGAYEQ